METSLARGKPNLKGQPMSAQTLAQLTDASANIGVGVSTPLAAVSSTGSPRNFLLLQNVHATQDVAVSFTGTAALNTAGSIMLLHGTAPLVFETAVPQGAISAIATGATTPLVIYVM